MIDIKFLRENPEVVKENIKKKFQDKKLPLVDEVIELDAESRKAKQEADDLRASRNKISKEIGALMGQGKKEEAEAKKAEVAANSKRLEELEQKEAELEEKIKKIMMTIPNIIDPSVPIGKDDSENVEIQKYGEPVVPDFEVPYHTDIMEKLNGIDLDSARKVAGNGFYYLMGDIARLHSAVISYARDFMIERGFTYCIPPFMIRSSVVTGVMSFDELKPDLVIGESLGSLQAIRIKGVPHLFVSPSLNAALFFSRLSWMALIPGVTWLLDRIYKPREGDRQRLHFTYATMKKYRQHRCEALKNTTLNGSSDYFFAFFGTRDHYRRSGVVTISSWEKYFGKTYQIYEGTHFMEEEHINALLVPKICEVLKLDL